MASIKDPGLPPRLSVDVNGRLFSFLVALREIVISASQSRSSASTSSPSGDANTDRLPVHVLRDVGGRLYANPQALLGYCVSRGTFGSFKTSPNSVAFVVLNDSGQDDQFNDVAPNVSGYVISYWAAMRDRDTDTEEWKFRINAGTLEARGPLTTDSCAFIVELIR